MSDSPININQRTKPIRGLFRFWREQYFALRRLSRRNHRQGAWVTTCSGNLSRIVTTDDQEYVGKGTGQFRAVVGSHDFREMMGISTRLVVVRDGL